MSALDAERQIRSFYTNQPGGDEENRPGLGVRRESLQIIAPTALSFTPHLEIPEIAALLERLDVEESPATNQW